MQIKGKRLRMRIIHNLLQTPDAPPHHESGDSGRTHTNHHKPGLGLRVFGADYPENGSVSVVMAKALTSAHALKRNLLYLYSSRFSQPLNTCGFLAHK